MNGSHIRMSLAVLATGAALVPLAASAAQAEPGDDGDGRYTAQVVALSDDEARLKFTFTDPGVRLRVDSAGNLDAVNRQGRQVAEIPRELRLADGTPFLVHYRVQGTLVTIQPQQSQPGSRSAQPARWDWKCAAKYSQASAVSAGVVGAFTGPGVAPAAGLGAVGGLVGSFWSC
ncbi:hypothetical protein V2W30_40035 (plasmid) [Streptomyces sp. Q6]|uniref:Uncharacterized protein n=1 Tax=Streptomyces citrinus TaxID=3118173 RepID=A0ACD5AQQ1_9ACTN